MSALVTCWLLVLTALATAARTTSNRSHGGMIGVNLDRDSRLESYYETTAGQAHSFVPDHEDHRLRKRAADDRTNNELYFECDFDIDTVLSKHTQHNHAPVVVRVADPKNMITTNTNPILSYTMLNTISYYDKNVGDVALPLSLEALVTTHTMSPAGTKRDKFTSQVDKNYNSMDRTFNHENYDERGHILADRLGGPMATYNIFPQAWRLNRGPESIWFKLESDLDTFVRGHADRYVRFTAVLSYPTDDNHVLVHRPSAVLVRVRAYSNGQQVDLSGNAITAQNPSTTEHMFFSNDANHCSAPLPAPKKG